VDFECVLPLPNLFIIMFVEFLVYWMVAVWLDNVLPDANGAPPLPTAAHAGQEGAGVLGSSGCPLHSHIHHHHRHTALHRTHPFPCPPPSRLAAGVRRRGWYFLQRSYWHGAGTNKKRKKGGKGSKGAASAGGQVHIRPTVPVPEALLGETEPDPDVAAEEARMRELLQHRTGARESACAS
jgi:hypothetical protein